MVMYLYMEVSIESPGLLSVTAQRGSSNSEFSKKWLLKKNGPFILYSVTLDDLKGTFKIKNITILIVIYIIY